MVPIGRFLVLGVGVGLDGLAVGPLVEIRMKRILGHPALESRSGQFASLEQGGLVVAGPAVHARPGPTDVARQHRGQIRGAIRLGGVEPMVDAFALVDGTGLDRGDVLRQLLDQVLGRPRDLGYRLQPVVLEMHQVLGPGGPHLDDAAVRQAHRPRPVQRGVDPRSREFVADQVPVNRLGSAGPRIPDHEIPELRVLIIGQPLHLLARPVGVEGGAVVRKDLVRPKSFEVVGPDQEREIGELFDEGFVVPFPVHHQPRHAQPQGRIGGRPDGHPVIGLGGRRAVLGRDHHDPGAALHAFDEPVGIGDLVLHQILPVHDDELREPVIVEITLGILEPVDPRLTRRLIAVPGVVGPVAPRP